MPENTFDRKAKVLAIMDSIPQELRGVLEAKVDEQGEFLVNQIRPLIPVDEDDKEHGGELRDSLEWHRNPNPAKIGVVVTEGLNQTGDPENRKGRANEFGRGGENPMEARPHFFPTFRANKKKISSRILSAARKKIRQIWGVTK